MKLNHGSMNKTLSTTQFTAFVISLFVFGLISIGASYYFLNKELFQGNDGFSKGPITSSPKTLRIDLETPTEDTLLFASDVIISGKTGPNLDVLIMTQNSDFVIKSDSSGNFSTVLELNAGPNKITAVVFDGEGDNRSAQRNVYYSEEKI